VMTQANQMHRALAVSFARGLITGEQLNQFLKHLQGYEMNTKQLSSAINLMGFDSLYQQKSSYPKDNAQMNLEGRTHFADDATLKYFGSRISSARHEADGLLFTIIESSFLDFENTKRGFRYAIFDIFGTAIHRLPVEEAFKTSDKARKALDIELASLDVAEHYKKALEDIAIKAERKAKQARELIGGIK